MVFSLDWVVTKYIQVFLNFRGFDFRDVQFNAVYNSILFSSPLVLLSNLDLRIFFVCHHFNSVNRGMPVVLNTKCQRIFLVVVSI
jgi:hypothetical protein